jgi:hypothetical protein
LRPFCVPACGQGKSNSAGVVQPRGGNPRPIGSDGQENTKLMMHGQPDNKADGTFRAHFAATRILLEQSLF